VKRQDVHGTFYPNKQEIFVSLLAHHLTTIESVKVIDNYHHWLLDREAKEIGLRFQSKLWAYKLELEERDKQRDFSYLLLDPEHIETSVQT
jgi:hypothetical protein